MFWKFLEVGIHVDDMVKNMYWKVLHNLLFLYLFNVVELGAKTLCAGFLIMSSTHVKFYKKNFKKILSRFLDGFHDFTERGFALWHELFTEKCYFIYDFIFILDDMAKIKTVW
jgi:hypothetical protein